MIGVESESYPSAFLALKGKPVVCGGQTVAEGIAVKQPGTITLGMIDRLVDDVMLVPEVAIERAIDLFMTAGKTAAEGAGAVTLAAVMQRRDVFAGRAVGLVLSGGNIDSRLLASILMRALIRSGRVTRLRIEIDDRPGALAGVAKLIGAGGGNILEVQHQRLFLDVPAKQADLEIVLETRDREHVTDILARLRTDGYRVRELIDFSTN